MAPKKKGNKKAQEDDWDADMGETITPQNGGAEEPKAEEAAPGDEAAGGGLMAALQRRGKKKKNKGADFELEGEDPPVDGANGADATVESKAPQEATFDDDEEDVFAGNYGKKKGKGGAAAAAAEKQEEPQEEKTDDAPRVKTKAEKEKEKKEKEKQRKKELVCSRACLGIYDNVKLTINLRLRRRKPPVPQKLSLQSLPRSRLNLPPHPRPPRLSPLLLAERRRSSILPLPRSRNNKRSARGRKKRLLVLKRRRRPG